MHSLDVSLISPLMICSSAPGLRSVTHSASAPGETPADSSSDLGSGQEHVHTSRICHFAARDRVKWTHTCRACARNERLAALWLSCSSPTLNPLRLVQVRVA